MTQANDSVLVQHSAAEDMAQLSLQLGDPGAATKQLHRVYVCGREAIALQQPLKRVGSPLEEVSGQVLQLLPLNAAPEVLPVQQLFNNKWSLCVCAQHLLGAPRLCGVGGWLPPEW